MNRAPSAPRTQWWLGAALCLITLLPYTNSFSAGFALDPNELVLRDPRIRALTAENLGLILHNDYLWLMYPSGLYRPITTLSFLFNYAILGNAESAAGYHWLNFLLHLGNVLLIFAVGRRLFHRLSPAFFAAALWAVHPIGTESVTNIGGRADLLSAMAILGGLLLYIRGREMQGLRMVLAAMVLLMVALAGVFSKENAAVLMVLMLLWDLSFAKGDWRRRAPLYGAAGTSLAILWWVRHAVFAALPYPQIPFVDNPLTGAAYWTARWTALKVIGMDLWLMLCPIQLSSDRSYHQIAVSGWSDAAAWLTLLVVSGILVIAIARRTKDPTIFWAAGFLGITLLPTSNLILPIGSIMAERFLYLPSIGFAVAVTALVYRLPRERVAMAILAVALVLLAVRTYARNPAWHDDLALASTDVETAPRSFKLHTLLAQALVKQDPQANIDRVIQELETALAILRPLPDTRMPQQNLIRLGDAYLVKANLLGGPASPAGRGWYEKALPILERARDISQAAEKDYDQVQLAHGRPLGERFATQDLYYDLGVAYGSLGRFGDALETLRYGRDINPGRPDFYVALAAAFTGLRQTDRAALALLEGTQVDASRPDLLPRVADAYRQVPAGGCAVEMAGGTPRLNLDCPRLRNDLCRALGDLAKAFVRARQPGRAEEMKGMAVHRYACPVQ